jgi:uncharacterized repeat protein (TIGR03803 family)
MRRIAILLGVLLGIAAALVRPVHAQDLYLFGRNFYDGIEPYGGVMMDASGALYGTTFQGGTSDDGTVYRLTAPPAGKGHWVEQVLWNFGGVTGDGALPQGDLLMDSTGAIYGTTEHDGAFGYGTVYQLTPPPAGQTAWTESVLLSFSGIDGNTPEAGLIKDAAGNLYGTTLQGGAGVYFDGGTVFELSPPVSGQTGWTEHVLYSFGTSLGDGRGLECKLVMDAGGNLYGTTSGGGSTYGTVFELSPPKCPSHNLLNHMSHL